ncbi:hypothetical protein BsWGS_15979 [Bradybaena similaris]
MPSTAIDMMLKKYQILVFVLFVAVLGSNAQPNTVIESLRVHSSIRYRSATTNVTSVIRNTAGHSQPVRFHLLMPPDAFIIDFSMTTGGVTYHGEIKERTVTTRGAGSGGGAGQIQQTRDSSSFGISLVVAAAEIATFTLTYTEVLKRKRGAYDHRIYVTPGRPVDDLFVEVFIHENTKLTTVNVPAIRPIPYTPSETAELRNSIARIHLTPPSTAYVLFAPSPEQQGLTGINGMFAVQYDVERSQFGDIVVEDGYFMHFFSPTNVKLLPKDIVFVLDVSGSMWGDKLRQMIAAMLEILSDLRPEDRFNIVTFSSSADVWTYYLQSVNTYTISNAKYFVLDLDADGGTNIYAGITRARQIFYSTRGPDRLDMIFFLTDGQDPADIPVDTSIPIYGLAFGDDADLDYITSLSARNSGFSKKIYTDKDAATQVENFYNDISKVPFRNVMFSYEQGAVDQHSLTQTRFDSFFDGSEIIVTGRLKANVTHFGAKINLVGQEGQKEMKYEVKDVKDHAPKMTSVPGNITNSTFNLQPISMEKLWAVVTIEQKLKEEEKRATATGDTQNLEQILDLSVKYGLGSPLTSVVVNDPQKGVQLVETAMDNEEKAAENSRAIKFIKSRPPTTTVQTTTTTTTTRKPWCRPKESLEDAVKSSLLAPTNVSSLVEVCMGAHAGSFRYFKRALTDLQEMTSREKAYICDNSNSNKKGRHVSKQQKLLRNNSDESKNLTSHRIYLTSVTITDGERSQCFDPSRSLEKDTTYALVNSPQGASLYLLTGWNKQRGQVTPNRLVFNSSHGHIASVFLGTSSMWRVTGDANFTVLITDSWSMSIQVENLNVTLKRSASVASGRLPSLVINYMMIVSVDKTGAGEYRGMLVEKLESLANSNTFPSKGKTDSGGKLCPPLSRGPYENRIYKKATSHAFLNFYLDVILDLKKNLPIRLYA